MIFTFKRFCLWFSAKSDLGFCFYHKSVAHQILPYSALKYGNKIAVEDDNSKYTYSELASLSNILKGTKYLLYAETNLIIRSKDKWYFTQEITVFAIFRG